jgi:hypothetical protein
LGNATSSASRSSLAVSRRKGAPMRRRGSCLGALSMHGPWAQRYDLCRVLRDEVARSVRLRGPLEVRARSATTPVPVIRRTSLRSALDQLTRAFAEVVLLAVRRASPTELASAPDLTPTRARTRGAPRDAGRALRRSDAVVSWARAPVAARMRARRVGPFEPRAEGSFCDAVPPRAVPRIRRDSGPSSVIRAMFSPRPRHPREQVRPRTGAADPMVSALRDHDDSGLVCTRRYWEAGAGLVLATHRIGGAVCRRGVDVSRDRPQGVVSVAMAGTSSGPPHTVA